MNWIIQNYSDGILICSAVEDFVMMIVHIQFLWMIWWDWFHCVLVQVLFKENILSRRSKEMSSIVFLNDYVRLPWLFQQGLLGKATFDVRKAAHPVCPYDSQWYQFRAETTANNHLLFIKCILLKISQCWNMAWNGLSIQNIKLPTH